MTLTLLLAAGLTLADLESRLLQQSPQFRQAEADVRIAEGHAIQAGLYPNPTIGSTGEHVSKSTRGGSVGGFVEQRIVLGGKLGIDQALARQEVDHARALRDAWRLRLQGELKARYYAALAAAERVKTRAQLAQQSAESAKVARELLNTGLLDQPDLHAADIEARRADLRLQQARQAEDRAWSDLAALLNADSLPNRELDAMIDDIPSLERDDLWRRTLAQSPEITAALIEKGKAEQTLRQARAARIPDLQIRAGLRNNREDGDVPKGRPVGVEGIFDIGIEIPIFNRQQGNIAAARARIEKAALERDKTARDLQSRFAAAWERYAANRAAVERYRDELMPAARKAYEAYQQNYRAMQAEYTKALNAQRTWFELQDEYVDALAETWHAAAVLESLLLAPI